MINILAVDDDNLHLTLIQENLSDDEFNVRTLQNSEKTLQAMDFYGADIALVDIVMPEKDGIEIIMEMRKKMPDIPIIVMSSMLNYFDVAQILGATECVSKPLDFDDLRSLIRKYVKKQ